ncbi:DUF6542 domain-containing protein [Pseudonocardia sp. KRD291]|uniref:DUF6542 domain-containing protein n=1 Tax=Pseudonocardia sp. KRD291 TaxID=2792007 RepID=UPI001C4A5127|nr:DUF6542 domain-containing protein [Pseudonocardia sp. KRD291]MBW0101587.1 hypothetical protein [Pseudonocardia sp. KRD291]
MTDTRTTSARRPASTAPGGRTASTPSGRRARKAPVGSWPVRERSLVKPVLGIPPVAAVAIAAGLTALGVLIDLLRLGTVGAIFEVGYFLGCVLAVAWVRRRSIFVPSIQPPLLLAVVVPLIAVLIGAPTPEAGATEHLLMAGAPLINAFPAMAVTTLAVLLVAGFRLVRQRTGPDDAFGQIRRRLPGDRTGDGMPDAGARPGNARPGASASGERRTGRGRRTAAPDAAARTPGARTPGARTTGARTPGTSTRTGADRAAPRTGAPRPSTGSSGTDEPGRPRRPRRS